MVATFPTSLDVFTEIPSGSTQGVAVGSRTHRQHHNDLGDAIEALEAKLGISGSTPIVNRLLRGDGTGSSIWDLIRAGDFATGVIATADIAAGAVTTRGFVSSANAASTTSASFADIADLSLTMGTAGGDILGIFLGSASNSTLGAINVAGLRLDSGTDRSGSQVWTPSAGYGIQMSALYAETSIAAGTHTLKARWLTNAGTLTRQGTHVLLMLEIKR